MPSSADPDCKEFRRFGDDGKGAYVNIVAWAASEQEFFRPRETDGGGTGLSRAGTGTRKAFGTTYGRRRYPEELITMRTTAQRQPKDVVFGTFHIWTQTDAS
jgi:hypothetical protein